MAKKCNLREVAPVILHVSILYPLSIRKQHNIIALNIEEEVGPINIQSSH